MRLIALTSVALGFGITVAIVALFLMACGPEGDSDNSATHFDTRHNGVFYHCIWTKVGYAGGMWCERTTALTGGDRIRAIRQDLLRQAGR